MAQICFVILNHTSAMISAITFSKSLVAAGHHVTIVGNDVSCKRAKENGLDAISNGDFTERSAPTGFRVAFNDRFKHWLPPSKEYIQQENEVVKKITGILQKGDFDLTIIDTMVLYPYIIASLLAATPVIRFTPNLSSSQNKNYPSISSTVTTCKINFLYKLTSRASRIQRYASVLPSLVTARLAAIYYNISQHTYWRKQLKAAGLKIRLFEYGLTVINIPELVAAPAAFEFPLLLNIYPKRIYIGACVDTARDHKNDSLLDAFDDKPLIYCALGTFSKRYAHAKSVFETTIAYAKNHSSYNFLIQYGDVKISSAALAPNIRVEGFVPQVEVLRKAALMITHGGLGSVREASYFGVPMLVIPGWNDQYGNAARVDFNGTGFRLKPKQFTIERLAKLIPFLLNDPNTLERVNSMKEAFQSQSNSEPGVKAVNKILETLK